jgi:tetratricopeptide (TPR) repeat protein
VLLLQPQAPNTLALYETYYKPYPNVFDPSVRGDEHNEVATIRQKAFLAYQAGHYAAAADYFKRLEPAESKLEQDNIRLYLGNCYLAMDSLDAAIRTLAQIDAGSHVASQATWYLAMAYLKAGTPDRAREVLQILAAEDGSYADRAHAILKQLD